MLLDELKSTEMQAIDDIKNAKSLKDLNEIRVKIFGKSGVLTSLSRGMRDVSPEERPKIGALINEVRNAIESVWKRTNLHTLEIRYPFPCDNQNGRPTNAEFLMNMAGRFREN